MLRTYELAYIADPELDEEALTSLESQVKSSIEAAEGRTVNVDRWGKRKLSYQIQKKSEGYYFFVEAELPPQAGAGIERELGLNEKVLRYMLTSKSSS